MEVMLRAGGALGAVDISLPGAIPGLFAVQWMVLSSLKPKALRFGCLNISERCVSICTAGSPSPLTALGRVSAGPDSALLLAGDMWSKAACWRAAVFLAHAELGSREHQEEEAGWKDGCSLGGGHGAAVPSRISLPTQKVG